MIFEGYRRASHFTSFGACLSFGELPNLFWSMLPEYLIMTESYHFLDSAWPSAKLNVLALPWKFAVESIRLAPEKSVAGPEPWF